MWRWLFIGGSILAASVAVAEECQLDSYFSPYDDIEAAIVAELDLATHSIDCSLFGITNPRLAGALIHQHALGTTVRVGLDRRQAGGQADLHELLQDSGIEVRIKRRLVLEHNKFCVIDHRTVIVGSWNWSQSAQKQDNSNLILRGCVEQAKRFTHAFARIWWRDRPQ